MCVYIYIYIYIYSRTPSKRPSSANALAQSSPSQEDGVPWHIYLQSEEREVLLRVLGGLGTLLYVLILSENSACQVPICAVAA